MVYIYIFVYILILYDATSKIYRLLEPSSGRQNTKERIYTYIYTLYIYI